jgi:branched-chain amino acid aminotransferase
MSQLWINGRLVEKSAAAVSPFDHGFLYGDGVWEGIRLVEGKLFQANAQLQNLFHAAAVLGIDIPASQTELLEAIEATVRANNRTNGYVRVIVTRGVGTIGPDPRKLDPQILIIAEEYQPFPQELAAYGLHLVTCPDPVDTTTPLARIATLGQVHLVSARRHALRNGCLDALLVNHQQHVVGTTEGAVFWSKANQWTVASRIPDCTVTICQELIREQGGCISPVPGDRTSLLEADEAFLAGTTCGVIAILRVDGRALSSGTTGPLTHEIRQRYQMRMRGEER